MTTTINTTATLTTSSDPATALVYNPSVGTTIPAFPMGAFRAYLAQAEPVANASHKRTIVLLLRTTPRGGASYHPLPRVPDAVRHNLLSYANIRLFVIRPGSDPARPTYDELAPVAFGNVHLATGTMLVRDVATSLLGMKRETFPGLVKTRDGFLPRPDSTSRSAAGAVAMFPADFPPVDEHSGATGGNADGLAGDNGNPSGGPADASPPASDPNPNPPADPAPAPAPDGANDNPPADPAPRGGRRGRRSAD